MLVGWMRRPVDHVRVAAVSILGQDGRQPEALPETSSKPASRIQELDSLQLDYRVAWPLSIVVDDTALMRYNSLLRFLLQVGLAEP